MECITTLTVMTTKAPAVLKRAKRQRAALQKWRLQVQRTRAHGAGYSLVLKWINWIKSKGKPSFEERKSMTKFQRRCPAPPPKAFFYYFLLLLVKKDRDMYENELTLPTSPFVKLVHKKISNEGFPRSKWKRLHSKSGSEHDGCKSAIMAWLQHSGDQVTPSQGGKKQAKKGKRANRKLFGEVAFSSDQGQSLGFNQIQNHSVTSMNNFADTFISVGIFILCRSSRNTVTKIHYDENPSIECALD